MNKYTIEYWYGSYSGVRTVWADDSEEAIAKMWRQLRVYITLPMAAKSEKITAVEYNNE